MAPNVCQKKIWRYGELQCKAGVSTNCTSQASKFVLSDERLCHPRPGASEFALPPSHLEKFKTSVAPTSYEKSLQSVPELKKGSNWVPHRSLKMRG